MIINATSHKAIIRGSCVVICNNQIIYAGPIKGSPPPAEKNMVLFNPVDYEELKEFVDRRIN